MMSKQTKSSHKHRRSRCPECNSLDVGLLYCHDETILYCRSTAHAGLNAYKTAHRESKDFGKKWEKVHWNYRRDEE